MRSVKKLSQNANILRVCSAFLPVFAFVEQNILNRIYSAKYSAVRLVKAPVEVSYSIYEV